MTNRKPNVIKSGVRSEFTLVLILFASASYILWSVLEPWLGINSRLNLSVTIFLGSPLLALPQ
jgi:hypothetical protein